MYAAADKQKSLKSGIVMPTPQGQQKIRNYLKMQFDLPLEQIDSMIPDFINTLADHFLHLEAALNQGDDRQLGKAGHTIKGALLNLGLHDCAEIAYQIEKNGKAGKKTAASRELVASLREKLSPYLM